MLKLNYMTVCVKVKVAYLGGKKQFRLIGSGEIQNTHNALADYSIFRPGGLLFRPDRIEFRQGGTVIDFPGRITA